MNGISHIPAATVPVVRIQPDGTVRVERTVSIIASVLRLFAHFRAVGETDSCNE